MFVFPFSLFLTSLAQKIDESFFFTLDRRGLTDFDDIFNLRPPAVRILKQVMYAL